MRRCVSIWLLIVLLARCGSSTPSPTPAPTPEASTLKPRTTVTFWHGESGKLGDLLEDLALDYQRTHATIEIHIEQHGARLFTDYAEAVRAGGAPDLVLLGANDWIGQLAQPQQRLLLDISDQWAESDDANLLPAAVQSTFFEGQRYGVPLTLDLPVLFFNRSNFGGTGAPPDTTDSWLRTARNMNVNDQNGLAYNLSLYFTQPYLASFGGQIFTDTGEIVLGINGVEGTTRWLEWLVELARDPQLLARPDHRSIEMAVQQNTAIMTVDWASRVPYYRSVWGDNVGVQALPRLSATDREPQPLVRTTVLALNPRNGTDHQTVALEFMRFLVDREAQTRLRDQFVPTVRTDLATADQPLQHAIDVAASRGVAWPTATAVYRSWSLLTGMLRNVLNGQPISDEIERTGALLREQR